MQYREDDLDKVCNKKYSEFKKYIEGGHFLEFSKEDILIRNYFLQEISKLQLQINDLKSEVKNNAVKKEKSKGI